MTAANALIGNPFNRREILQFATDIEGHPDNVAPAIFGGFTVNAVTNGRVDCFSFLPRFRMKFVVAVPNFPLSTRMARKVLPTEVPMKDAIFNIGRASMLVAALTRGNERYLRLGLDDALHQPYRAELIPGMYDVFKAARAGRARCRRATLSSARQMPSPTCWSAAMRRSCQQGRAQAFHKHDVVRAHPDARPRLTHGAQIWK